MPRLANVFGEGLAEAHFAPLSLVNVAAKEVFGLVLVDELAYGMRSGVQAGADFIERGSVGRRMAHQHQRRQIRKRAEAFGDFGLTVLTGGVEGGRIGVT